MLNKYLESKVALHEKSTDEETINLEYYLLESSFDDYNASINNNKVFGLEVVKRKNDTEVTSDSVVRFSYCRETTQKIINRLAENSVTPVSLKYILDDMIGI